MTYDDGLAKLIQGDALDVMASMPERIAQIYRDFLDTKRPTYRNVGVMADRESLHPLLFDFQKDMTLWALRKGRAALFADTGLGKTLMQIEWARLTGQRAIIIAPLTVVAQTIKEAAKIGVRITYVTTPDLTPNGISITNYERALKWVAHPFNAVILDESSILKAISGKTREHLTALFANVDFRLCCTATPAPNDIAEIANHSEFLGVMRRVDMMAKYFVHDDEGWRLKRHAHEAFFKWLASWSMSMRQPSDLGYSDDGFILPALDVHPIWLHSYQPEDSLFHVGLHGIQGRLKVRRATISEKVSCAQNIVANNNEQWLIWVGLNDEGRMLHKAIPGSVLIEGIDDVGDKIERLDAFLRGDARILITKPRIAGFGMNLQHVHNMLFVGLSDSWEYFYQCIRRCWRFGQTSPVSVGVILDEAEDPIWVNVQNKEAEALSMRDALIRQVINYEKEELQMAGEHTNGYRQETATGKGWELHLGDACEKLEEVRDNSVGLSVFSPPFLSLYTYSPSERDLGNCDDEVQFMNHFGFIIRHILRATMPGRICAVHTSDVPAMLVRDGYIGMKDFSGMCVRAFSEQGWIYHGRVTIDKNPQAQAIRTKSKGLLFAQLRKDSSWSRPALADYILLFRKPGDNEIPVHPDIDNNTWIEWARPIWMGIRETDTLQYTTARAEDDERHLAPLQLQTIERCIRLWSNPGELVLSPFAGIGSEGYQALKLGRRFVGIELKLSYWEIAKHNLETATYQLAQPNMFDVLGGGQE